MVGVGGLITLLSIRTSAASILVFSILVGSSCLAFREVSISHSLIAKIAIESEDLEIIISSTAALKTLGILQQLGFVHVSIDQYADV